MKFRIAFALAAVFLGGQANGQLRLEQVLGTPFPSELRASAKGDGVAWVFATKGVRNVWVAMAPGFEARQITQFPDDDGKEISDLTWKPDSSAVAFTRGDTANPRSDPAGSEAEVWVAALGGPARKVAEGSNPVFSPDGGSLVFLRGGQVWAANLTDEKALTGEKALTDRKAPAQWIHARGRTSELRWSPDGKRLAFRSDRGDHAFIGVYTPAIHALLYLDPSVDRDQSAVWSPDSKQIAFIRIPAMRPVSPWGQSPKAVGEPWSIRLADAGTGEGREVWHASPGMGSRFWGVTAENQLLWADGGRLVFPWERDGWLHLYAVLPGQPNAVLLTPGAFEVEHVALSRDAKSVVYSSNQDDLDRRHIWRVRFNGGAAEAFTKGTGIEYAPAPLEAGQIALLRSNARAPARVALANGSEIRDLAASTMPAGFPVQSMIDPQAVTIQSADGMQIHGQLFLPEKGPPGPHPAVIFFHGGPRRQMLLGWNPMFYYHQAYGFNQYLASRGYVVLSVNYRSGAGYGEAFREAKDYGATGASEYNDVIGAGLFLRNRMDVDAKRIGLWGGSYGGYLTALGLARASEMFAAGVDLHGVHDWNLEYGTGFDQAHEDQKRLDFLRTAFLSSPMASMETWKSPVLLIQGDDDRNVAFANTVQLAEALRARGVPFEQLIFPDEVHDFLVFEHWLKAYHAADRFFEKYLRP